MSKFFFVNICFDHSWVIPLTLYSVKQILKNNKVIPKNVSFILLNEFPNRFYY
jgi:hypothetical protein